MLFILRCMLHSYVVKTQQRAHCTTHESRLVPASGEQ